MASMRRACRRLVHLIYRPYALWRISKPGRVSLAGMRLHTDPQVFHPVCFHSGRMLVSYLRTRQLAGRRFLDMGTGSGLVGIWAARAGADLTACDVNVRAVELARENARVNGVAGEILESNLFSALTGRRFDFICFNLPFYPRAPQSPLEAAFFAGPDFQVVRQFAKECPAFLAPGGSVVVIFSEDSGRDQIVAMFTDAGLAVAREQVISRLFERHHLVEFQIRPGAGEPRLSEAAAR
jgi:release factor glutamine methyltransferase